MEVMRYFVDAADVYDKKIGAYIHSLEEARNIYNNDLICFAEDKKQVEIRHVFDELSRLIDLLSKLKFFNRQLEYNAESLFEKEPCFAEIFDTISVLEKFDEVSLQENLKITIAQCRSDVENLAKLYHDIEKHLRAKQSEMIWMSSASSYRGDLPGNTLFESAAIETEDKDERCIFVDDEYLKTNVNRTPPEVKPVAMMQMAPAVELKQSTVKEEKSKPKRERFSFAFWKRKKKDSSFAIDSVQFSAVVQSSVKPGAYLPIDILMYEDEFRKIVDDRLKEAARKKEIKSGYQSVQRNSKIKIVLSSTDVEITDNEEERIWSGKYIEFGFVVMVPEGYDKKQILFTAKVYVNDVIATKLKFFVDCHEAADGKIDIERADIFSAFVSYASQDRNRVASIIQGMKKARPEMDIFFDIESLRSGQKWETRLKEEIDKRDILFLCWSTSASKSKWVDMEWRYALEHKGEECIEPVPIEPPDRCPPPIELQQKHFNDKMVYVVMATKPPEGGTPYLMCKKTGEKIAVNSEIFDIGSFEGQVDYLISSKYISKIHASIVREADGYYVLDRNSRNKTYVDGVECAAQVKVKLQNGSVLKLADEEFEFWIF